MSLESQINETIRQIEQQDSIISDNDAKIQELGATVETLDDELELTRVQIRDIKTRNMELEEQLRKVRKMWTDKRSAQEQHERTTSAHSAYTEVEGQVTSKEEQLREVEAACLQLQHEIEQERHGRIALVKKLAACTEDLHHYIQKRHEEGLQGRTEPLEALRRIKEIERERERDLRGSIRDLREAEAIVAMKTNRAQQLEDHSRKESEDLARAKTNEAQKLRIDIEDSKQKLLGEIEDLKRANDEQAINLRKGALAKGEKRRPGAKGGISSTYSPRGALVEKTEDQLILENRNRQLADEKKALMNEQGRLNTTRRETIQKSKHFKQQVDRQQRSFDQELAQLDREYESEKKTHEHLRKEARALEEQLTQLKFMQNRQQKSITRPPASVYSSDGGSPRVAEARYTSRHAAPQATQQSHNFIHYPDNHSEATRSDFNEYTNTDSDPEAF
eukprot:TRINITY_DN27278_c0_g1_i1.p2 TRINITY_DN27278_c0_g1~~TRINITY_DN27278_c0_g1_i1.p2  ORF type:complete len:448 (+),score=51.90 TRINITY_DN27278_c0_g1_i1:94-1437(+)